MQALRRRWRSYDRMVDNHHHLPSRVLFLSVNLHVLVASPYHMRQGYAARHELDPDYKCPSSNKLGTVAVEREQLLFDRHPGSSVTPKKFVICLIVLPSHNRWVGADGTLLLLLNREPPRGTRSFSPTPSSPPHERSSLHSRSGGSRSDEERSQNSIHSIHQQTATKTPLLQRSSDQHIYLSFSRKYT